MRGRRRGGRRRGGRRDIDREGEIRLLEGEEEGDVYVSNKPTSPSNKPISLSTCMLAIVHTAHSTRHTAHTAHVTQHTKHVLVHTAHTHCTYTLHTAVYSMDVFSSLPFFFSLLLFVGMTDILPSPPYLLTYTHTHTTHTGTQA